jgi:membrane-associated phospholipid phosphatase
VALGLCGLGCVVLPIDVAVARWIAGRPLPGEVNRLLGISEAFAQGWGVAGILLTALVLDTGLWQRTAGERARPPRASEGPPGAVTAWMPARIRPAIARLLAMAVTGGLLVDLVKLVVRRVRPRALDLHAATNPLATFDTALVGIPDPGSADLLSFPSGHAAAAAGLAAALAYRYPRGRWLFVGFATLAALQRVSSSAHYPSDILFGAALGCVGAALTLWLETRLAARKDGTRA